MKVKTVYYDDLLNDEFSGNNIKRRPLGKNFKYVHTNVFWRLCATLLYRLIAIPVIWIVGKIGWGVKTIGKKNVKPLKRQGYFIYGNHTQICDAWTAQCYVVRGHRTYIVSNQDSTSIRGIRWLIQMLGCIPTPENMEEREGFNNCIRYRIKQKAAISIFPEAHIWPYSTHIRPFKDDAFVYPAELGAPVVAMCTTYRRRKLFKNLKPRMTLHISAPIYPNMRLSLSARKKDLRDQVYDFMVKHSAEDENIECIRYLPRPKEESK